MTRGNQRDKAREANQKKQAALVCDLIIAATNQALTCIAEEGQRAERYRDAALQGAGCRNYAAEAASLCEHQKTLSRGSETRNQQC